MNSSARNSHRVAASFWIPRLTAIGPEADSLMVGSLTAFRIEAMIRPLRDGGCAKLAHFSLERGGRAKVLGRGALGDARRLLDDRLRELVARALLPPLLPPPCFHCPGQ